MRACVRVRVALADAHTGSLVRGQGQETGGGRGGQEVLARAWVMDGLGRALWTGMTEMGRDEGEEME